MIVAAVTMPAFGRDGLQRRFAAPDHGINLVGLRVWPRKVCRVAVDKLYH
jgi:hypothetical protein